MSKTALITGITGQAASFLAELLLSKDYNVVGLARRTSTDNTERISHLLDNDNFTVVQGDVTDPFSVHRIVTDFCPDEIFNLAAQSHVKTSFCEPIHTTQVTYLGCLNLLEAIRSDKYLAKRTRFYQASSSEMFGGSCSTRRIWTRELPQANGDRLARRLQDGSYEVEDFFQDENTPFSPNSPYAIAKLAAHHAVRLYREAYGLFSCSGILHNHESNRRSPEFVTRKITQYVANWVKAKRDGVPIPRLRLGNLSAKRDWGHAKDYVRAQWLMLQQDKPDDYVICTGQTYSVEDFLKEAFAQVGVYGDYPVEIDQSLFRPSEVPYLRGDYSKAKRVLGWEPQVSFHQLVSDMVLSDLQEVCGEDVVLDVMRNRCPLNT